MFFPLMTLMADAARVIEIRIRMMALGQSTPAEMFLMVSEKMNALEQAKAIIARGGNPSLVIENYQKIVAANVVEIVRSSRRLISSERCIAGLFGFIIFNHRDLPLSRASLLVCDDPSHPSFRRVQIRQHLCSQV